MNRIISLIASVFVLTGCNNPETVSAQSAVEISSKISYFKDSRGICYAAIGSYSYGANVVTSITAIPCDKAGL